jgi:hypothetical protein
MAQQTAIEWFYQRILAEDIKAVFEEAKQKEKEQIIDAVDYAVRDIDGADSGEQYYNITYNK